VSDVRNQRIALENWVKQQETVPNRKVVQEMFPQVPQRVVRQVLQSAKDRDPTG